MVKRVVDLTNFGNLLTYLVSYLLTAFSRVLLEKLTGLQVVKKFPTLYETRRCITAFTSARRMSLSLASSIQSIPIHTISWRSILILSSHPHLGLPSGFFLQVSPPEPCIRLSSHPYVLHAPPISFFSHQLREQLRQSLKSLPTRKFEEQAILLILWRTFRVLLNMEVYVRCIFDLSP